MFNEKLRNDNLETLDIQDVKFEVLEQMINFIYKDRIENLKRYAAQLVFAAENYKLDRLKKICEKSFYDNLITENVIETLIFAHEHNLEELLNESLVFMEIHIKLVVRVLEWDCFIINHTQLFNKLVKNWIMNNDKKMIKLELEDVS